MENFLKTSLLTALTIIPTAYISTIGLISWSQNVPTSKQVEEKIWDEAPYAVGAHVLVIINIKTDLYNRSQFTFLLSI